MRFYADLHIHSKYARACSKDCDLEHLTWWARRKGVTLLATGDFTHPAWFAHLNEMLVPAEPGLFRLKPEVDRDIVRTLPASCAAEDVRYVLSVEISTIYKRGDKTRKVHHLVYMPDFASAAEFNRKLGRIGNLGSDGRPIIGLDSRDLLEIALESSPDAFLIPAHVWTPWFAVFGSKSGFDAIEDCYLDLAHHIFALETGLSSDPAMNWRVSSLDKYRLISSSDAHSAPRIGREATALDTDLDYFAIRRALETGDGHAGTIEFFPEEGMYHVDGHRKCGVRLEPHETQELGGICPECGKPLTIGVLNRVDELADRPDGFRPEGAPGFRNLVPLPEIMSEILGVGPKSKKVSKEIDALTAKFGSELTILDSVPVDDLERSSPLLGEAIGRLRRGEVIRHAGYDGEYGEIKLFQPGELSRTKMLTAPSLFDDSLFAPACSTTEESQRASGRTVERAKSTAAEPEQPKLEQPPLPVASSSLLDGLDPDQRAAAEMVDGALLIVAGPGTGKTRTLTHRIAHMVLAHEKPAKHCLAITFTRRAAEEMTQRLHALLGESANAVTVTTFHSLGVRILREQCEKVGLTKQFGIADQSQQEALLAELTGTDGNVRKALTEISRARRTGEVAEPELIELVDRYVKSLRERDLVDFDDLVALSAELLSSNANVAAIYQDRYRWISVDEYQDVDEQQYRLLLALAGESANITAIGDPDQAIYRFRGADVGFFLRFHQDFPRAKTVQLTRNYRSAATIVAGATQMIEPTTLVPDRILTPAGAHAHNAPALIGIHQAVDERAEATFVARTIDQLLGGSSFHSFQSGRVDSDGTPGLGFSDFAVLYRTDRQAEPVIEALTHAGMPFQKRSHDQLLHRPAVRQILRELSFTATNTGTEPKPTGEKSIMDRVRQAADMVLRQATSVSPEERVSEVHSAVELLGPLARRCGDDVERFHTELALGVEVDTWDPRADRISLLTLHAAKGLEFPVVFLVGCEDGLIPLRWPGSELAEDDLREERRLLFVGMTRAEQHLYLSHAAERYQRGTPRKATKSPWLADLDPAVYEHLTPPPTRRKPKETQLRLL